MNKLFSSINEGFYNIIETLHSQGSMSSPRGKKTKELINYSITISNPRNRILIESHRKISLPLLFGEFAWHFSGSNDVERISYYASQWSNFSKDGKTIRESAYGRSIFKEPGSQLDKTLKLLNHDRDSRRAIAHFVYGSEPHNTASLDVACANFVHFFIRNDRLEALVNMRSQDIVYGFPYDVFFFTMLQEYISDKLGIEVGNYHHCMNSVHIYEKNFKLMDDILGNPDFLNFEMPKLPTKDLPIFLNIEEKIRKGTEVDLHNIKSLPPYWQHMVEVLLLFAKENFPFSTDNPYLKFYRNTA